MKRTKKGYMLINEKKHFVYDGLNIIGRQKGATVIIPDTSVSHYHSTVVIIEDRHYLSDISSSNGTYLREHRLNPLQLYELNTGNNLKFGLVQTTYFKFTTSENSSLEGEASQPVQFDEDILSAGTQVCDIDQINKESDRHITGKPHNTNSQKLAPNLQAELFGDHNGMTDEELELVAGEIENSFSFDEISGKPSTSTNNILINDLPTQIVCSPNTNESIKESDISCKGRSTPINHIPIHDLPTQVVSSPINETKKKGNEKDNTSINTSSIHNLPTQLISEKENETEENVTTDDINGNPANALPFNDMPTQLTFPEDDMDNSLANVSNIHQASTNVIEETITTNNNVEDDQDSRESTDFLTMQPAATQNFNSDTQSQLFLENLKRRVKYVIESSDDDSCNLNKKGNENSQQNNRKKATLSKDKSLDEETECEFSQIKMKKLTKTKPVFDSDSDDSTDIEEPPITMEIKVAGSNKTNNAEDDGSSTDSDLDIPLEDKVINTTTGTSNEEQNRLDDSDIIPTTQAEPSNNSSATAIIRSEKTQETKINSQASLHDNNFEASLAESFCLHLTDTQQTDMESNKDALSKDKSQANTGIDDSTDIFIGEMEKPKTPDQDNNNETKNEEHDVDDVTHTQLEVIFDDSNLPEEKNDVRPGNPLINILDTGSSTPTEDTVENKLAKMFQSQVDPALIDKDIFVQPKQVAEAVTSDPSTVKDDDIFLAPTQMVTNKTAEVSSKNKMTTLDTAVDDKETHSDDEDIFLQPTQVMSSKCQNSDIAVQKSVEAKLSLEKDEDIFLQPTQVVCTTTSNTNLKTAEKLVDDVFLQPTQILSNNKQPDVSSSECTSTKINIEKAEKSGAAATDIFLQPTQILCNDKKLNITSESSTDRADSKNESKESISDDIFLQPTQVVSIDKQVDTNSESDNNAESKKLRKNISDDVFLQPTQVLCDNKPSNTFSESTSTKTDTADTGKAISSEDIFLEPTQVLPTIIISSENNTVQKETEQIDQINIADEIFLKTARDVNSKSEKLTNFLNSLSESSDSDDSTTKEAENDSNLKKKSKSSRAAKRSEPERESGTSTGKRISERNTKKQQDTEAKDIKASGARTRRKPVKLNQKQLPKAKQTPLYSDSDSTDVEDAAIINDNTSNLLPDTTVQTTSNHSSSDESETSTKRKLPKRNTRKTENNPTIEDNATENKDLKTRKSSRNSPMIEITPKKKSQQVTKPELNVSNKKPASSTLTESKTGDKNKSSKSRNKKDKTEHIASNNENEPSKVPTENISEPIVDKTECQAKTSSESHLRGGKTKSVENEDNLPTKKKKIEDSPVPVATRRSTRKNSTEEKTTSAIASKHNLGVIQEIKTPQEQGGTTSEDEFVQTNRATPSRTRNRLKQTPLSKNQKTKESEAENKRKKPKQLDIIEGNAENSNEPVPSSSASTSTNISIEKPEINNTISSTRHSKRLKTETEVKHDEPQPEFENKMSASTRRTRKTKTEDKEEPPSDSNKNESEMVADTSKQTKIVPKQQRHLSKEEIKPSSPIMLARRSRKFKTDEMATEQHSSENESSCSSVATSSNIDSQKRNTRKRRFPSKTSEDDFQVTQVQKEKTSVVAVPPTPERAKRLLKPKVVFTMLDSPQLETIIRSLGGFVVDSIELSTVLVTGSIKRSQKLLSAVGQAKPICSPRWLHESKKANHFVDPWDYILEDEEAETKWNFSLKESLRRSSAKKLLANYTFQIMVNTAQDVLKGSIESCGGKCVTRAPAKGQQTNFIIVAGPENKNKYARFLKQNPPPQIIAPEAIFDGVLRQELHFEDHILS